MNNSSWNKVQHALPSALIEPYHDVNFKVFADAEQYQREKKPAFLFFKLFRCFRLSDIIDK